MTSILLKAALALSFAGMLAMPTIVTAEEIPVPSQVDWAGTKQTVKLANGISIAYVEMGDTEGKPTLLIHGYTDNSRSWSLLAPYLKDRRLIAIDLRGHGKSDAPDCCYTLVDFANDAHLFLNEMKIDKADIIGHSLGSMTTQYLAARHPEQVGKVVLISSTLYPGSGPGSWLWDNISTLKAPIDPDSQFMKDWYTNPNPVSADYIDRERAESAATPLHVWNGVLWGLSVANLTPIAPLVKSQMLILWGDQDGLFDAAHQERLKKAYPEARFETFVGAGHNMFWEFPENAGAMISDFLNGKQ